MSRVRLRLPGEKRSEVQTPSELSELLATVGGAVKTRTMVTDVRRGGAMEHSVIEAEDQDVLQLSWGDDIVELVRVSDLSERFSGQLRRSGEELELPAWHSLKSTVRGEEGLPLRSIEHIALQATEAATGLILPSAIRRLEEKYMPEPGVFEVLSSGKLGDEIKPGSLFAGAPVLALVHGTFSSTAAGFGDLFGTNEWTALHNHYSKQGGRVIALEQRTVCESPVKHALDLARVLHRGAQLHLLTHSRGGLVGELLARHPWNSEQESLEYFFRKMGADDRYALIREELSALSDVLSPMNLQIERFVRVAAPAAGTLLASERLDRYLNVILSVLSKAVSAAAPWFSFVKTIATTIVHARIKVEVCPGLEAMMPHLDRGLVPFLNAMQETEARKSNLAVVAGDVEGGNVFDRIKAFFADLYFNEANDFVVDSASMLRGVRREAPVFLYHRAPQANHFGYFSNEELRKSMTNYLQGTGAHRFVSIERLGVPGETRGGAFGFGRLEQADLTAQPGKPIVFLLPGIMGSHLGVEKGNQKLDRIWVDLWNLTFGGLDRIHFSRPGIVPDGIVRGYYKRLAEYLNVKNEVRLMPFDWRLPIAASAQLLKAAIEKSLSEQRTIRILAHSMGGLVSRTFIWESPEIWNKVVERGGRLVMLGTPNFGSYVPAQVFTQQHGLMRHLATLDSKNNLKELTAIVREFPGLLEMLPLRAGHDLLSFQKWDPFAEFRPASQVLDQALIFRRGLDVHAIDPGSMVYVAGQASETPIEMALRDGRVAFRMSPQGDGTVPWELGRLPGVETYYVPAAHGDLPAHEDAFGGYAELLARGRTNLLAKAPAHLRRGEDPSSDDRWQVLSEDDELARYYPSEMELLASLMTSDRGKRSAVTPPVHLSVINKHLQHVDCTVIVGHYEGDAILSAERAIDQQLGLRLSRDYKLQLYPGPRQTNRIFFAQGEKFPGALVVGLGKVGELTRLGLQSTLCTGLLDYAMAQLARHDGKDALELSICSLLVGTWGTRLTLADSVEALANAVLIANERLAGQSLQVPARFAAVSIVELYRDEACEAARAALAVAERSKGKLIAAKSVIQGKNALRTRPASPYESGWQRRVSILVDKNYPQRIDFQLMTESARADNLPRYIHWEHVQPLLEAAPKGDVEAPAILFQYLMPSAFSNQSEQGGDMVLVLDNKTAQIPWELLGPRDVAQAPLGVRVGVLRNLSVNNPPAVRRATGNRALVIGNPVGSTPLLPAASDEAKAVARALQDRGMVTELLTESDADADRIFRSLYREEYDIIHIAAHGALAAPFTDPKLESAMLGVVLNEGRMLTTWEFENLKAVPSIVFLNCCHLGRVGDKDEMVLKRPGQWAASLAECLIRMGVAVVVVAGWAVGDHTACVFAETLYAELLDGRNLITAVRMAREATYHEGKFSDLTWGAYQVYGAPGFVMRNSPEMDGGRAASRIFVVPSELVDALADLGASTNSTPVDRLEADLEYYRQTNRPEWEHLPDVTATFGEVYFALGHHEKAVEFFRKALPNSAAPLRVAEQLSNAEARQAEDILKSKQPSEIERELARKEAEKLFDSSAGRLAALLQIAPSAERHSLLGATYRRMAEHDIERDASLQLAIGQYEAARELQEPNAYYPITLIEGLKLCRAGAMVDPQQLDLAKKSAQAAKPDDVWAPIALVDIERIRRAALLFPEADTSASSDSEQATIKDITEEYFYVLKNAPSSHRNSVLGDIERMGKLCLSTRLSNWLIKLAEELRVALNV